MKTPRFLAAAVTLVCVQAYGAGHCAAGEDTFFSCTIRGSAKVLSVCGGADWMQYRFGKLNKIELEYPSEHDGSFQRFTGASRFHKAAGVSATWLMFEQAGNEYAVSQVEGGSNLVGVAVSPPGAPRSAVLRCDPRKPMVTELSRAIPFVPEGNP